MDIHHPDLHPLFAEHMATLTQRSDAALAKAGFDHLLIPAGNLHYQFLDDRDYPFCVNPQFKHWLPVTNAPGSWLVYTPGRKPKLVFLQPADYWHVVPEAPAGYWVEHFDIIIIREAEEALAHLPKDTDRCAIIGETGSALGPVVPNNPQAVIDHLHYHRMCKTTRMIGAAMWPISTTTRSSTDWLRALRIGHGRVFHVSLRVVGMNLRGEIPSPQRYGG